MIGKLPPLPPAAPAPGEGRVDSAGRVRVGEVMAERWRQVDPGTRPDQAAFEALVRRFDAARPASRRSLRALIAAQAMPENFDTGLLRPGRLLDLLDHVVEELLPDLEMDESARGIARLMIEEEIAARLDLDARRQEPQDEAS